MVGNDVVVLAKHITEDELTMPDQMFVSIFIADLGCRAFRVNAKSTV